MNGETQPNLETIIAEVEKPEVRVTDIESFETERGSVYSYDDNGRTQRYKTVTKELDEFQDLTVFVDLDKRQTDRILTSVQLEDENKEKTYIVERDKENRPRIIRQYDEISNPEQIYLDLIKDGHLVGSVPASLRPKLGATVFDTRHYSNKDGTFTERHLGHRVAKITPRKN